MTVRSEQLMRAVFVLTVVGTLPVRATETEQPQKSETRKDCYGDPLPPRAIARLGTVRLGGVHGCLVYSPDGKLLASATGNAGECVTLWDVATGQAIRRINASAPLSKLAFSPDGKRLACSSRLCRVIETASGKELYAVAGIFGAFSGDGKMLVTSGTIGTGPQGYVWDAVTGRQLRQWTGEKGVNGSLASVGGKTLAIFNWDSRRDVDICDIATGNKIRSLRRTVKGKPNPGFADGWRYLTLSRDDKTLVAVNAVTGPGHEIAVELMDVESGKTATTWRGHVPNRCVLSPDGKRLAWTGNGGDNNEFGLWVSDRDGKTTIIREPGYSTEPPCFSPDGRLLAAVTGSCTITLRNADTGTENSFLKEYDRIAGFLTLTPDGRDIITRSPAGILFVREARSGRLRRRVSVPLVGREYLEHVLPDGRMLTFDPDRDLMYLRNTRTGGIDLCIEARQVNRVIEGTRPNFGRPYSYPASSGSHVAVQRRDGSAAVFDLRTSKCKYTLDALEARQGLKLSDDGDVLAWYSGANGKPWNFQLDGEANIHVRHHSSGKTFVLHGLPKPDRWVSSFKFHPCLSPNGRRLVLPTDGRMQRWNLTTGEELSPLTEPLHGVNQMCWSPDRRVLAVRGSPFPLEGQGFSVRWETAFWDVSTGARLKHLKQPNTDARDRFSPDGRTMLSTDSQGVIHLREITTGEERAAFKGHLFGGWASALILSADGRTLVSSSGDSQILVWDVTGRMPDGQWHPVHLSAEQCRAAWEKLASVDAKAAHLAMWQLIAAPEGSIALLREQVRPIVRPKPEQVARLITALDSEVFAEREQATEDLEKLGETVVADLRQVLSQKPTLEVRKRIEALLAKLEAVPHGRRLQALRAVEVLEHLDTPEARTLLRQLAEGAAGARLTEEARQSLRRSEAKNPP